MVYPDSLPVKIRFDETSQLSKGSANVSVTTFLSCLQKLPKIVRDWSLLMPGTGAEGI